MWKKAIFTLICLGALLLFLETALRLSGVFKTYTERTGGYYYSYYNKIYPSWYLTYPPDSLIEKKQTEFTNSYRTNSLGLRERQIPMAKPDSVNRYFVLGDSFTEGDGVDYEHSMPRYLEKDLLQIKPSHFEVYNCGIAGSDVCYNFTLFRDKLLKYHPTHLIMCFNNSDIDDIILRGGMERFQNNGTTHTRKGPWWQGVYAWSHTVRMVAKACGYDETLMTKAQHEAQAQIAIAEIYSTLKAMRELCEKNHIQFVSVLHPFPNSFHGGSSCDEICSITQRYPTHQINLVNLFPAFAAHINKDNWTQYGWPINKHFNDKGYELYAKLLMVETLKQKGVDFCGVHAAPLF